MHTIFGFPRSHIFHGTCQPRKSGHLEAMSTVAEIEAAIEKLPSTELGELLAWLEEYKAMTGASDALFAMYDEEEQKRAEG